MSELDLELAALGTADAKAREAKKRIRRSHITFVVGIALFGFAIASNPTGARPPLLEVPFILLLGAYVIWSVYLVFPPMWRKAWSEERAIGCNPATLLMAVAAFAAVFCVAILIGPFGGGIWSYVTLRKAAR